MMYMYPYIGLNSFEGASPFVQAQGFAFQQQQNWNWNLYNQLTIDPFITDNTISVHSQTDRNFSQYNSQQNHEINKRRKSSHVYSKYTIPSITSIISQQQRITTNNANMMNFLSLLTSNNVNNMLTPPSIISTLPSKSSLDLNFNYNGNNENSNLLIQSQPQSSTQSSDTLSYFAIPDKDATIPLQDIIDGMKVMQEISTDLTNFNSGLGGDLLQDVTNNLVTNLDENSIDWLINENWENETYDSKGKSSEEKQDENFYQDVGDLIEEHMKEVKKVIHNEILCREILTESSSSLEYQDLSFNNLLVETDQTTDGGNSTTPVTTTTTTAITTHHQDVIIKREGISQETVFSGSSSSSSSSSSSNIFVPQENNFSYDMLTNSTNLSNDTADQRTLKCDEVGCSKEYNCYAKLKSHKVTHTNDRPFLCNFLGCNKKFKRSGELTKHQWDHITNCSAYTEEN